LWILVSRAHETCAQIENASRTIDPPITEASARARATSETHTITRTGSKTAEKTAHPTIWGH
jgi:hypothetical protein